MKYLKKYENFSVNEEIGGVSPGAVAGGLHKSKQPTKEEASEKPDEFLTNVLVNRELKKWGSFNCKVTKCDIHKEEEKKGFFKKLFSGSSYILFELKSDSLKLPVEMAFELKKGKFERTSSSNKDVASGYVDEAHQDKFIKWVLTQSQWKDELKKNFENISELLTKESF